MADLRELFEHARAHRRAHVHPERQRRVRPRRREHRRASGPRSRRRSTRTFGFDVTVLLRTPAELAAVVKRNPYGTDAYVTFLDGVPDRKRVAAIDPSPFAPDEFTVDGQEVFVRCPNGYGRTKINNTFFETQARDARRRRATGKPSTTLLEWATRLSPATR